MCRPWRGHGVLQVLEESRWTLFTTVLESRRGFRFTLTLVPSDTRLNERSQRLGLNKVAATTP